MLAHPKPAKRSKPKKAGKDEAHLARVRDMSCIVCGKYGPSEPHHPRSLQYGTGMGMKAPDNTVIPLCNRHHHDYHRLGVVTWERLHGSHEYLLEKTRDKLAEQ